MKRFQPTGLLVTLAAVLACTGARDVRAGELTFPASRDATLYEEPLGTFANGSGDHFFAGTNGNNEIRRGIIAFDVTAIPPGATVVSAELTLFMSRTQAPSQSVSLHRVLADWGEGASHAFGQEGGGGLAEPGDATWIHTFFDTDFWATPGGDFEPAAVATTSVANIGYYSWSSSAMDAMVQSWVDDPSTNFGWLLRSGESSVPTAKRFDSRSNVDQARRPVLSVNFTLPADTGACCFIEGDCQVLLDTDCAAQSGVYQGDATLCTPNPCPQPEGACCFPDAPCQVLSPEDCAGAGGYYGGTGTACTVGFCESIPGACCQDDATCTSLTLTDCDLQGGTYIGQGVACEPDLCPWVLTPYVDALPVPAVATPISGTPGGEATYEIAMRQFEQQLHAELPPTVVWGYGDGPAGGTFPGPTIEATVDEQVTVIWTNDLRDAMGNLRTDHYLDVDLCPHGAENVAKTVVHLHGTHAPEASDGYPEYTFLPGEFDVYEYPNHQLPATLWYHDHALGITRMNVYMGLAGFYLIRDAFENGLGLPDGAYEIPLVVQDRSFHSDGSLKYPSAWQGHFFGDQILVNGKVWPYLEVDKGKYRFRLLNGSNSRAYTFTLSNGASFSLIGTDGGLLPAPVVMSEITLLPAERADLIVDFEPYPAGTEILLSNSAPAPFPGPPGEGVVPEVMKFIVTNTPGHVDDVPASLRAITPLPEEEASVSRDFLLRASADPCTGVRWLINDLHWAAITEEPVLGTSEIWRFINPTQMSHPMHLHLVSFQVLDSQSFQLVDEVPVPIGDPVPPPPHLAGWKDTVDVPPDTMVRVIAKFEDYTGLFAYHCHILEHEDHEMMRQFRTVECTTNAHCSDGQFCNGFEVCDLGTNTCLPGTPTDCVDLYPCTIDICDPAANGGAGGCLNVPDDSVCDNGLYCDGVESCISAAGCISGQPPCEEPLTCDEEVDMCTGCTLDEQCSDGNVCTDDFCDAGMCFSLPAYSDDLCCDPADGSTTQVDDGDPCTYDICDAKTGDVAHVPNTDVCAEGVGCRYLRVTPQTRAGEPVAIVVTDGAESCFQRYVQADGTLGATPVFATPEAWGTVDARGAEIFPDRIYHVRIDDGEGMSPPITAWTWLYGDVNNNGTANLEDVQQVVLAFQQVAPYNGPRADLKPCVPNTLFSFEDVFAAVQAFQGIPLSSSCTDPCQ